MVPMVGFLLSQKSPPKKVRHVDQLPSEKPPRTSPNSELPGRRFRLAHFGRGGLALPGADAPKERGRHALLLGHDLRSRGRGRSEKAVGVKNRGTPRRVALVHGNDYNLRFHLRAAWKIEPHPAFRWHARRNHPENENGKNRLYARVTK